MNQTSNEHFRTTDNLRKSFTHSCLGRLVIFGIILVVLLVVAHFNVPDKQVMTDEIEDDIRECILTHDSIKADWLDDAIGNIGYIFTNADSAFSQESWRAFQKYNKLEYHKRATYASMHLHNNLHPEGVRVGIGIFGVVIPTIDYEDLLLRVERMHGGYDKGVIQTINYDTDYMGEQPHIKEYHYKGDQTQ